jgi:hypothetical protein
MVTDEPQARMGQRRALFTDSADARAAARSTDWMSHGKRRGRAVSFHRLPRGHVICHCLDTGASTNRQLRGYCQDTAQVFRE